MYLTASQAIEAHLSSSLGEYQLSIGSLGLYGSLQRLLDTMVSPSKLNTLPGGERRGLQLPARESRMICMSSLTTVTLVLSFKIQKAI